MFGLSKTLCLLIVLVGSSAQLAWADAVSEDELKAALVYKFAQFTDWPSMSREFDICVLGSSSFSAALDHLAGKRLKEVPLVVRHPLNAEDGHNCQIAVLNPPTPSRLAQWLAAFAQWQVLTISDDPGSWDKGVMIVLSVESNRIRFDINASAARKVGLSLRAQMLKLAREVR